MAETAKIITKADLPRIDVLRTVEDFRNCLVNNPDRYDTEIGKLRRSKDRNTLDLYQSVLVMEKEEIMGFYEYGVWNNNPVISIKGKFKPWSFGLEKAKTLKRVIDKEGGIDKIIAKLS